MDAKFKPAETAIEAGDLAQLNGLVKGDPSLATDSSRCSHPTLLQCLVLKSPPADGLEVSIKLLASLGAELTQPLIAAQCMSNLLATRTLLDLGANIEGNGAWSPLEEALYWGGKECAEYLVSRGAAVDSLRKAAALGRLDYIAKCFTGDSELTPAAGCILWPWWNQPYPDDVKYNRQQIIDNALVYAAAWGQIAAAKELLARGANINALPAGFDYVGTPLHYAAMRNQRETVDFLLKNGADPNIRDPKVNNQPAGWAEYAGHTALASYLAVVSNHGKAASDGHR